MNPCESCGGAQTVPASIWQRVLLGLRVVRCRRCLATPGREPRIVDSGPVHLELKAEDFLG